MIHYHTSTLISSSTFDEGNNLVKQNRSIVTGWFEHMKHMILILCFNHFNNTTPTTFLKQFLIIPTPILQNILPSNTNKQSLTTQLPQIRIISRVNQRVIRSIRSWTCKTP
ncbi:hypothetical protein MtrunA17_Chr4g0045141 [Medicago truncatula]|uniref:Uncharacterized protein n=1 Tax=Medicago truncatula TaxID=3880 RepID=A0A396I9E0_MEDTR|nr:hypothetical protein MtrunA17_Chr4g0045141 [Medicago truncatula]